VHTFLPYAGTIGRVIARLAGVKRIISTQCNVRVAYSLREYWMDRLTLPLVHAWTATAEGIEMEYGSSVAYWGKQAWGEGRRHYTIAGGVDCSAIEAAISRLDRTAKRAEIGLHGGDVMVMMTARLVSWKGHEDIIDAMALLPANMHLYLAGWGDRHQALVQRTHDRGIQDRVHFLGSRSDVYELLGAADVYVQSFSRTPEGRIWMGPSLSQMEACAAGVPSVSTAVPLIERLIEDNVTGVLALPNNPSDLARAIQYIRSHPHEAQQMAERARARVDQRYSIRAMVSAYQSLYEHVVR
jgi:glycosyltransferase involved in cell wall biosynthesis